MTTQEVIEALRPILELRYNRQFQMVAEWMYAQDRLIRDLSKPTAEAGQQTGSRDNRLGG